MLKAPTDRAIQASVSINNKLYEMETTTNGRIYAIWALLYLPSFRYPPGAEARSQAAGAIRGVLGIGSRRA